LERGSEHPIARAIVEVAEEAGVEFPPVTDFAGRAGLGATGTIENEQTAIGKAALLEELGQSVTPELDEIRQREENLGRTAVLIGWGGAARGVLSVADTLKPTSAEAIAKLNDLGLRTILLTGD